METLPGSTEDFQCACIFCKTGSEQSVARAIMRLYPALYAQPVRQVKHQSVKGIKTLKEHMLLPGYVFISVPRDDSGINLYNCARLPDVYRLLTDSEGHWALWGSDERFARWVINNRGIIGLSRAYKAGDKVRMLSGPLKEMEGNIIKIDRRGRNGLIEVTFDGHTKQFWLAFEYTEVQLIP